jgi:hypothetical protein
MNKINKSIKKDIRIGLVHVKPIPGNLLLKGAKGAFVQVLSLSINTKDFIENVTNHIEPMGYKIIEIEDIELFKVRKNKYKIHPSIIIKECIK